jgi:hypothetical protein
MIDTLPLQPLPSDDRLKNMGLRFPGGTRRPGLGPEHAPKSRLAMVAALAGILLLSGCASAAGTASPGSSPSRSPGPGASLSAASPVQLCTASALRARGGRQGENMGAHGDISFTNVGTHPCILRGIPRITLLSASGTPLAVHRARSPVPFSHTVVMAPGKPHAAWLEVYWSNWCGPPPGPLHLQITLANGRGTLTSTFDGPPDGHYVPLCLAHGRPSTLAIIDAYIPGSAM